MSAESSVFGLPACPPCPSCGAAADAPCVAGSGNIAFLPHVARGLPRDKYFKYAALWRRREGRETRAPLNEVIQEQVSGESIDNRTIPVIGMTPSKMLGYLKRWKALEAQWSSLDYDTSKWCHDIRSEFPDGILGDDKLRSWIDVELGITVKRREEIISRAAAFAALPDRAQYEALGGYRHAVRLVPLSRRERTRVIGEARANCELLGRAVTRLVNEKFARRVNITPPVKQMIEVRMSVTPKESKAWESAATAAGQSIEDWVRSVCNREVRK